MLQTDDILERTFLQSSGVGSGVCWDRSYVLFQENKCTEVCEPTLELDFYFLTYLSLEGFIYLIKRLTMENFQMHVPYKTYLYGS